MRRFFSKKLSNFQVNSKKSQKMKQKKIESVKNGRFQALELSVTFGNFSGNVSDELKISLPIKTFFSSERIKAVSIFFGIFNILPFK